MGLKQDRANVSFSHPAKGPNRSGYVWMAPLGTTLPTDATTDLDAKFVGLGYISEDGLTEPASYSDGDSTNDAGGEEIAKTDPTFSKTWTGTAVEVLNVDLLKAVYGPDNVTVDATTKAITIKDQGRSLEEWVIVVDELLKGGRRQRSVMPDATFLITDDTQHHYSDLLGYGFTITAYATADNPPQTRYIAGTTASAGA